MIAKKQGTLGLAVTCWQARKRHPDPVSTSMDVFLLKDPDAQLWKEWLYLREAPRGEGLILVAAVAF